MKYVFVFLAIYLLATTFAAQSKNKMAASEAATREAAASLKRLSSTKLGKTLLDTIQIELKSNTGADPRPRIFQLLQEILDETNDQINTLNDNIATVRQGCEDTQNQLNTDIADLNNQIDAATQEQAAVQADLASLTDQHDAAVALGESYQSQLDALNNIRAEHKAAYDAENARLLKIRSVLEQTNGFIQDRIQQRDNPSFLQRNNILMEIKRKVMSPEFQAAASGWGKFINFLATKALAKIKQTPDDQAQEGLARIVIVINDLIESVNLDINFRNAAEQTEIAIYEPARDNLEDVLSTTNAQIASLELNIGLDNDRLTVLAASLQNNGEILEKKQQELADEESYCQQQEDEYSQVFAQRNNEVEIINEVIDIIKNQLTNLHAAVESVINSSESSDSEDQ